MLTTRQRRAVLDAVDALLAHEPNVATRNRKAMRPNALAPWELRIGELRVYYDIQEKPEAVLTVRAIGIKRGNQVRIGGQEFEL